MDAIDEKLLLALHDALLFHAVDAALHAGSRTAHQAR
jgi:hypothetical protein